MLIVTQTKEVAKEILTHAQMFMLQAKCSFACLFDDENINTQAMQLRERGQFFCQQLLVFSFFFESFFQSKNVLSL